MTIQRYEWLYLANATVLLAHQIDAAYWHEWELFGMPGGIQLNVLLNLPIILLILWGLRALAIRRTAGFVVAWLLVAAGLFAACIHSFFLLRGDESFTLPVSLALLIATSILSPLQAAALWQTSASHRYDRRHPTSQKSAPP